MSIQYLCDFCKKTCPEQSTKRWDHIQGDLGLEVIVLQGHSPARDMHICGDCITKMFWIACNKNNKDDPINKLKDSLQLKAEDLESRKRELEAKRVEMEARIEQLRQQHEEILLKKVQLDMRETKVTAAEVATAKWEQAVRLSEARGYQRAIDEREYPEYIDSIEANALKRAGI